MSEYPAYDAALARRSLSKVTEEAPGDAELAELLAAAGRVADHSSLRPWRLITLRGEDRTALGEAMAAASGDPGTREKYLKKAHRAPLLIAIVARPKRGKVPVWEQEAVASGVAHLLSLLLFERGWGVLWRTGELTRDPAVHAAHALAPDEYLLGWLYVGGTDGERRPAKPGKPFPAGQFLSPLGAGSPVD